MLKLELVEKKNIPQFFHEKLPLYLHRPSAGTTGFPSPADDYLESTLDLNKYLQVDKSSVFLARACGESMVGAGIEDGDLLIVDKALKPQSNDIVICTLNGELVVKRFFNNEKGTYLMSDNPKYLPLLMGDGHELLIWGVCINVVKELKKRRKNVRAR